MKTSAAILALVMGAAPSWACSPMYGTTEGEIFHWSVIFDGTVAIVADQIPRDRSLLDWGRTDSSGSIYFTDDASEAYGCRVSYFVNERFRGIARPIVDVVYVFDGSAVNCMEFRQVGDHDLVLAMVDNEGQIYQPETGNCYLPIFGADELRATARRLRTEMLIW
ncbi:hypothetical protein HXX25_03175 [Hyphobacterium sp. CCMP332]|uniref:hypothetical protein n=1 Tax=Hyphobacterium sp. CCMP332 TaxID=2749086 RepID=UPI0016500C46|nr:hypothetical protein [Hyphobacterium sp. CCMP332]QNL18429.1 hypothetical protein HXX25_03175 [Hyphobacterium sp. CCMP332]